jgi:L-ribulose-5-phosphate 4-epimerase
MIATARRFYDAKLQMNTGGNLSARFPGKDLMIVKAREVSFLHLDEDTLVTCDFDGNLIEGEIKPSKEALLHGAIYKAVPWVQAVMHCHSPWATGWAASGKALQFSTYHSALKLKAPVPTFDSESYAVPKEYFPRILAHFEAYPDARAFLLKGHGQVALGASVWEAAFNAELVEETAWIALVSRRD